MSERSRGRGVTTSGVVVWTAQTKGIEMQTTTPAKGPGPAGLRLWTINDVSAYLGVPVATLYHWRVKGYGPTGVRVGRFVRYRGEDVEAWVEAQRGVSA